jgi:predicted ATPase
MITRIEIDGFKSFQSFDLSLEPFSALFGPNGAGKSNLLDVLSLLSRMASVDLATAFGKGRGRIVEQFARQQEEPAAVARGFGVLATMKLAVELLLFQPTVRSGPGDVRLAATRLRYEIALELQQMQQIPMRQRLVVVGEALRSIPSSADPWLQSHPELRSRAQGGDGHVFFALDRHDHLSADDPCRPDLAEKDVVIQYVPEAAFLSTPDIQARSPHALAVAQELRALRVVHLDVGKLREPSERAGLATLGADGANLAAALAKAQAAESPVAIAQVRADLASLVPGVRDVAVRIEGDGISVEIDSTDGQRYPARVLSDGTLRILALSTLLRTGEPGALVAVEEPENGLHPMRVRMLIERTLAATRGGEPRQVLVTSHSPIVLAALIDHPSSIVSLDLVRRGTGLCCTRARRVAQPGVIDPERYVSAAELRRILEMANPAEIGVP